jgi:agmatinase
MPTPGGLSFGDVVELLRGVAAKAEICGGAIVEYVPERDNSLMLSGLTAAKLGLLLLGLMTD